MNTFEKLQELIADILAIDPEDITLQSDICKDLGADSFDWVEIIHGIEVDFDIEILETEEKSSEYHEIGKLVDLIESRL